MSQIEKDEISKLDPKYEPLGAWAYFGYSLLFSIPIAGFICLIVFSFNDSNINRRNFARSHFCIFLIYAILLVIAVVIFVVAGGALGGIAVFFQQLLQQLSGAGA